MSCGAVCGLGKSYYAEDGYGFGTATLDGLAAEVDRADKAEKKARAAFEAARAACNSCQVAAAKDKKDNKPERSCEAEVKAAEEAKEAADRALRILRAAIAAYRSALQNNWDTHHSNKVEAQKVKAMLYKIQQIEVRIGDPVGSTTGVYILEEQDGVIERSYRSRAKGKGALGKWWASSLDERLIHGVNFGAGE